MKTQALKLFKSLGICYRSPIVWTSDVETVIKDLECELGISFQRPCRENYSELYDPLQY